MYNLNIFKIICDIKNHINFSKEKFYHIYIYIFNEERNDEENKREWHLLLKGLYHFFNHLLCIMIFNPVFLLWL